MDTTPLPVANPNLTGGLTAEHGTGPRYCAAGTATHLGAVDDGGLVHVVPDVQVLGCARVAAGQKVGGPPRAHLRVHHVQVGAGARPAPAVEVGKGSVTSTCSFVFTPCLHARLRGQGWCARGRWPGGSCTVTAAGLADAQLSGALSVLPPMQQDASHMHS